MKKKKSSSQAEKKFKIIVTNPKTEEEKAEMLKQIGKEVSEYFSNNFERVEMYEKEKNRME